jgi:hypothetical protein
MLTLPVTPESSGAYLESNRANVRACMGDKSAHRQQQSAASASTLQHARCGWHLCGSTTLQHTCAPEADFRCSAPVTHADHQIILEECTELRIRLSLLNVWDNLSTALCLKIHVLSPPRPGHGLAACNCNGSLHFANNCHSPNRSQQRCRGALGMAMRKSVRTA